MKLGQAVVMDFWGGPGVPWLKRLEACLDYRAVGSYQAVSQMRNSLRAPSRAIKGIVWRRPRRRKNPITLEDP